MTDNEQQDNLAGMTDFKRSWRAYGRAAWGILWAAFRLVLLPLAVFLLFGLAVLQIFFAFDMIFDIEWLLWGYCFLAIGNLFAVGGIFWGRKYWRIASVVLWVLLNCGMMFLAQNYGRMTETMMKDICLDDGGVWDGAEKRCRHDCLTWNERDGCVPLEKMKVEKVRAK